MIPPTVSVVMLVYNGERFLREAIESTLNQTYADFELLIIDDGSVDNTPIILQDYAGRDPRIHIVTQPQNMGIAKCRNLGLQLAQGKYLAMTDADDVSLPERLAKQVAYLESHPETGVLGTSAWIIDETGQREGTMDYPFSYNLICWALCYYDPIINPAVMMRTELVRAAGGYHEEYLLTEDYELWTRLSDHTRLENFPERLLLLRKHGQNITIIKRKKNMEQSANINRGMFKRILNIDIPVTPVELAWEPRRIPAEELRILSTAILLLRDHFLRKSGITSAEKAFIRHETAIQLARLVRNAPSTHTALELANQSLRCDPGAVFEVLQLALRKLVSK